MTSTYVPDSNPDHRAIPAIMSVVGWLSVLGCGSALLVGALNGTTTTAVQTLYTVSILGGLLLIGTGYALRLLEDVRGSLRASSKKETP